MSPRRFAARLVVGATLVGAVVAGLAAWGNIGLCPADPQGPCVGLVRSMSLRVGLLASLATVLMTLTAVGLSRTMTLQEERRTLHPGGVE